MTKPKRTPASPTNEPAKIELAPSKPTTSTKTTSEQGDADVTELGRVEADLAAETFDLPAPAPLEPTPPISLPTATTEKPATKLSLLVGLLYQPDGTTLEAMMAATGWQAHSVRGALSGSLKKGQGLAIGSAITETGRRYFIDPEVAS
jgi:hypothetical protein